MKVALTVLLLASLALAGCSGGGDDPPPATGGGTTGPLASGKGAINGLLINDVFRPVPDGLVLIQELGLTATSDASGQFTFVDLAPGTYLLRVQAEGHEAAPQSVDVREGEYAEAEVVARRVFNEASRIITTEFSVFIPCSFATPPTLITFNCVLDLSGDTFRSSTPAINFTGYTDATYLVAEVKVNQVGNYVLVLRPEGSDAEGISWGTAAFSAGDYGKVVLTKDEQAESGTMVWDNTDPTFEAGLFVDGQVQDPTGTAYGVGASTGVKAKILMHVFLGEPDANIDVQEYCVLC